MAKKYKVVFYAKTQHRRQTSGLKDYTYQYTYRGDTLEQAVIKGMIYAHGNPISSFTILRGEAAKRNVKFPEYIKNLYK